MSENNSTSSDVTTEQQPTDVNTQETPSTEQQPPVEQPAPQPEVQTVAPQVVDQGTVDQTLTEPVKPTEVKQPVVKETTVEPEAISDFLSKVEEMKVSGTSAQKILIASIEKYLNDMAPGKQVEVNAGARSQYSLWKAISYVVETAPAEEFKKLWSILLAFFEEYKDKAFHDRYVFRFSEYWLWPLTELNGLHRIINIIKLTSNAKERAKGLKQVDLDRSLAEGFSDEARQKLISFYRG